jgi:hypothetical protein
MSLGATLTEQPSMADRNLRHRIVDADAHIDPPYEGIVF